MKSRAELPTRIASKSAAKVFLAAVAFLIFAMPQSALAQTQIHLGLSSARSLEFTSTGSRTTRMTVADATVGGRTDGGLLLAGTGINQLPLNHSGADLSPLTGSALGGVAPDSVPTPEPMTFFLFGGGLLLVGWIVHRHLHAAA